MKDFSSNPHDKLSYTILGDSDRALSLAEDIHSLAFTLCLNRSELVNMLGETEEEKAKKVHCMPDDAMKNEVFIASIFCAVVQMFISCLLLGYSFRWKGTDDNVEFTFVSW